MNEAIFATAILAGMCLLMWFLARVAKKRMGVGSGVVSTGALRVVGKKPLDQKSTLWVVEVGGRHLLLGSGHDGSVAKLDDISADEFAVMTEDDAVSSRPKLRLALAKVATNGGSSTSAKGEGTDALSTSTDADAPENDGESDDEQRFATVGESFNLLLGKARDARANRKRVVGE
jgi:flagellar biogenesis protein FliO